MTSYGATAETSAVKTNAKDEPQGFMEHAAPYMAEFVGTFLVVFTMGCCIICGDPMWNPTAMAFTILVAVYSFCPVSGAHLNPAVSLCLAFVGKFPVGKMAGYMIAQFSGGLVGALCYWAIFNQTVTMGPPKKTHFEWYDYCLVEALYTFMYCFVYMNCLSSNRNNREGDENHFYGLAIGFVYIAGGYPCLNISGSIFNPAAALAIGVTGHQLHWAILYIAAQAAGAWLASFLFAFVRPEDFKLQYDGPLEEFEVPVRAKHMSEFVGTFLVVMTVGLNLVMISPAGPWSSAAAYLSLIYALGDVSGAHFNPAVTLAVMLSRRGHCSFSLGQSFILNQLLAGAAAGVVYVRFEIAKALDGVKATYPLGPKHGSSWGEVGMAEVLFTMVLAFAYLALATSTMPPSTTRTNLYFGFGIGSCISIGGFAIGSLSGGMLNPAVSLGRALAQVLNLASLDHHGAKEWYLLLNCVWFGLFELGGGVLAALLFSLTHQKEYLKDGSDYPHIP